MGQARPATLGPRSISEASTVLLRTAIATNPAAHDLTPLPDASTTMSSSSGDVSSSSGGGNVDAGGSSGSAADASSDAATLDADLDASTTSCQVDDDCNGEAGGTRPAGTCQLGICVCNPGFECAAGSLGSETHTNLSCGDKREATCCFAEGACKGPTFRCVAPNDAQRDSICANGWRTCEPGLSAMAPRP